MGCKFRIGYKYYGEHWNEYKTRSIICAIFKFIIFTIKYDLVDIYYSS